MTGRIISVCGGEDIRGQVETGKDDEDEDNEDDIRGQGRTGRTKDESWLEHWKTTGRGQDRVEKHKWEMTRSGYV